MWNKIDQGECEKIFRDRDIKFEIVDGYTCAGNKATVKCLTCGHIWDTRPRYLLDGHGCPKCSKKVAGKKQRLADSEFTDRFSLVHTNIALKSEYLGMGNRIRCQCEICEHEWFARPYDLLRGRGCPSCKWGKIRAKKLKSHKDFVQQVFSINPSLQVLSQYDGSKNKVNVKCLKCEYEWFVSAGELLHARECPMCVEPLRKLHLLKNADSVLLDIQENLPNVYFVEQYSGRKHKLKCGCSLCGNIWETTPEALLHGQGCPNCDKVKSYGERIIRKYLDANNVRYIEQYKPDGLVGTRGGKLSYDFYLCDYQSVIEYNGQYHDGSHPMQTDDEYYRQIEHDKRKHRFAIDHDLNLLYIWYWNGKEIFKMLDAHLAQNVILPCNDHTCASNCVGYASSM